MAISITTPAPVPGGGNLARTYSDARQLSLAPVPATTGQGPGSPGGGASVARAANSGAQAFFSASARDTDAMAALRGGRAGLASLVAAAYSTAPIIRPGQFVNIYA